MPGGKDQRAGGFIATKGPCLSRVLARDLGNGPTCRKVPVEAKGLAYTTV